MRVAVYQSLPACGDKAANLDTMHKVAASASLMKADLAVFSELYLTRYNIGALCHELAEPSDGPSIQSAKKIAARTDCALAFGYPERAGDTLYNSMVLIGKNGDTLAAYRKVQVFGEAERALFEPGDELVTCRLEGAKLGLAICYDIEFPEFGRRLARAGVDLAIVPTANMAPYWEVPTSLVRARALENGMAIAYANQSGSDEQLRYTGQSCLVGADGVDLARAGVDGEALLIADVKSGAAKAQADLSTQLQDMVAALR
ncbi:MAG: carbon-nitrogen hydrolase family protein [Rhodospirillales bacterium]|nr:carbon-nitrogen hydrolase family protein [Rhodospirillales bacterium]